MEEAVLLDAEVPLWLHVGYWEGVPASSSEVGFFGGGVAGLYNLCTLEAHRRGGISTQY